MLKLKEEKKSVLTKESVGFDVKVTWLAISKMYNQMAQEQDATVTMGFVLLNINEQHGTAATKIAPLLGMEPRSLTRLLKKMEEKGVIVRKADKNDKRSVRIHLTDDGMAYKKVAEKNVYEFNMKIRASLPQKKLDNFFEVLEAIHAIATKETNGEQKL